MSFIARASKSLHVAHLMVLQIVSWEDGGCEGGREGGREEREVRRLLLFEAQLVDGRGKCAFSQSRRRLQVSLSLPNPTNEELTGTPAKDRGR